VPPKNTSKACSQCGQLHDMPLNIRTMECDCGLVLDRDVNAARNILCLGEAMINNHDLQDIVAGN